MWSASLTTIRFPAMSCLKSFLKGDKTSTLRPNEYFVIIIIMCLFVIHLSLWKKSLYAMIDEDIWITDDATDTHTYTHTHVSPPPHTHTRTHAHTHTHAGMHAHTHTHTSMHTHTQKHRYTHTCMHTHTQLTTIKFHMFAA